MSGELTEHLTDIASQFSFGISSDRIRHPKFDPSFHDNCVAGLDVNHLMIQFPIIMRTLEALPDSIASRADPAYAMFIAEKRVCSLPSQLQLSLTLPQDVAAQAAKAMRSKEVPETEYRTIFHEILDSKLPPQEKTIARLGDDASVTVAGEYFF
jgi:hypothetical protein